MARRSCTLLTSVVTEYCKLGLMTRSQVTLHVCVVVSLLLLSQLTLLAGADDTEKSQSGNDVTVTSLNVSSTQNVTSPEGSSDDSNTGTIVAVSIICLLLCIAIVIPVYFFRRKRQSRMMDKENKMQIQMSSARNAGVYQDLTVSIQSDEKPPASPEHERLNAAEDV